MAISGLIGAGAQDGLQDLLARQLVEQQLAERVRIANEEMRRRDAELGERQRQFDASQESINHDREERQAYQRELIAQRQAGQQAESTRAQAEDGVRSNMANVMNMPGMTDEQRLREIDLGSLRSGIEPPKGVTDRLTPKKVDFTNVVVKGPRGQKMLQRVPNTQLEQGGVELYDEPDGGGGPRPITGTAEANLIGRLAGQWTQASKNVREMDDALATMQAGLSAAARGDNGPAAEAIMVTFQKVLDPGSVVREAEFWRSASGQSLRSRIAGAMEKLRSGGQGIPAHELQKYAQLAQEARNARAANLSGVRTRLGRVADRYGVPHELIFDSEAGAAAQPDAGLDGMAPAPSHGGAPPAARPTASPAPTRLRFDSKGNPLS
jgi:hypothetical protein